MHLKRTAKAYIEDVTREVAAPQVRFTSALFLARNATKIANITLENSSLNTQIKGRKNLVVSCSYEEAKDLQFRVTSILSAMPSNYSDQ
jgi:hypothetical protein